MASDLPPPPSYTTDNAVWINWFVTIANKISTVSSGGISHNNLLNIQGGSSTERYHLLQSEAAYVTTLLGDQTALDTLIADEPTISTLVSDAGFVENMANAKNAISTITVGSSPFTYTNPGPYDIDVVVDNGTVTSIQFNRGSTTVSVGSLEGMYRLNDGDSLIVTYSATPNMYSIPR